MMVVQVPNRNSSIFYEKWISERKNENVGPVTILYMKAVTSSRIQAIDVW